MDTRRWGGGNGKKHLRARPEIIRRAARAAPHQRRLYSVAMGSSTRIRVVVAFHSIFYAPLPVAIHGGHFLAEGLEVDPETPALAAGTVGALQRGDADVALSGIMRSFELADRGDAPPVHFAAVNDRNGFFLLSRQPQPSFGWSDLIGRTVVSFGGAPTPRSMKLLLWR